MRKCTLRGAGLFLWCFWGLGAAHGAWQGGGPPVSFPEIPGFTLTVEATVYEPSNLWDFIDGAADLFVSYGFLDLRVGYYRTGDGVEIRAEVYRHDTPENAFGMYSQERSPGNTFVEVGTQGYTEEGIFNFLTGRYYVKLSSNRTGDSVRASMLTLAQGLQASIGQQASWPRALALLPVAGRVANSEQYIAESYLGYTFLKGAYTAQYRTNELFEIFLIPTESDSAAASMVAALAGVNRRSPSKANLQSIPDAHQGDIALVLNGKYLGGILRCTEASQRLKYLEILQSSLR